MAQTLINQEAFNKMFYQELNHAMSEAAEPILKKALEDIEKTMREKLAQKLISCVENNFSIDRMGQDIRITVRQVKDNG